jgi:hypothetical protein
MEKAMSAASGFIGIPRGDSVSVVCAACHSDATRMKAFGSSLPTGQWEKLQASAHGKSATTGGTHLAQCTTCHDAHGVAPASTECVTRKGTLGSQSAPAAMAATTFCRAPNRTPGCFQRGCPQHAPGATATRSG